jgi:hypothetical protein
MSQQFPLQLEARLKEAWNLFLKAPEVFITISFGLFGASFLLGFLPGAGSVVYAVITALGPAAFYLAADEASRRGIATFDNLKKLQQLFPQLLALLVVKWIVIAIGLCLLVLPGIYVAVLLCFAELFVVIEGKPFLEAMRASKNLVQGHWFTVFGMCLAVGAIFFSGFLLVGIGLLLTAPFACILLYCVFKGAR